MNKVVKLFLFLAGFSGLQASEQSTPGEGMVRKKAPGSFFAIASGESAPEQFGKIPWQKPKKSSELVRNAINPQNVIKPLVAITSSVITPPSALPSPSPYLSGSESDESPQAMTKLALDIPQGGSAEDAKLFGPALMTMKRSTTSLDSLLENPDQPN